MSSSQLNVLVGIVFFAMEVITLLFIKTVVVLILAQVSGVLKF